MLDAVLSGDRWLGTPIKDQDPSKMVHFAKQLELKRMKEWQEYYIEYRLMKKKIKHYAQQYENKTSGRKHAIKEFTKVLDDQVENVVLFLLTQEGLLAAKLAKLGQQHASPDRIIGDTKIYKLREDYRAVGQDLLNVLSFIEINVTGIRKILKKFDKHFRYRLTDYYIHTRANHPYSQLQQLFTHVGLGAVVGAVSNNLKDLQEHQEKASTSSHLQDPIVDSIQAAMDKMKKISSFLRVIAHHTFITQEELSLPTEDQNDNKRYHFLSLLLILDSTFLYMVNTYIIVPTADDYSRTLGLAATACGIVIGAMPLGQVFSSIYSTAWSSKSYFTPLVIGACALLVGNTLYALAYDFNSFWILLIGRLLCGLGFPRAVSRKYISDCVPLMIRMQASAGFVTASVLGVACGPALAGLLQADFEIYKFTFNEQTLPGWIMAVAWLVHIVCLCALFKEPLDKINDIEGLLQEDMLVSDIANPLLLTCYGDQGHNSETSDEVAIEESRGPPSSILSALKLLESSAKVQLMIYFMLKYAMEILLSESGVITTYYFDWSTSTVAILLACTAFTGLPVKILAGAFFWNTFEERTILLASEVMVLLGIVLSFHVLIPYSPPQYICAGIVMFLSAGFLEGINLSLLSRVMPPRLLHGTYSGGLLTTEAGTIARVIADSSITLFGYFDESNVLNLTLLPLLFISVSSIIATCCTYNSLH